MVMNSNNNEEALNAALVAFDLEEEFDSMTEAAEEFDDEIEVGGESISPKFSEFRTKHKGLNLEKYRDQSQLRMWNMNERISRRRHRKTKRLEKPLRKHRLFEMARTQVTEMKDMLSRDRNNNEDDLLELNKLSVEVSSALAGVEEIEKRRQEIKHRLAEVQRATRLRRPRSAEARPSALMSAVKTSPTFDTEDTYTLELTKELTESLPVLLEAREVLESLQNQRLAKLSEVSASAVATVSGPEPTIRTPLVMERQMRAPKKDSKDMSLLSLLGLENGENVKKTDKVFAQEDVGKDCNCAVNWTKLAEARSLTPAHEVAQQKLKKVPFKANEKRSLVKFALDDHSVAPPVEKVITSDPGLLWKQPPSDIFKVEPLGDVALIELSHEAQIFEVVSTNSSVESMNLLLMSLKDCAMLKDFAITAHAFVRFWGSRRQEFRKERAFVEGQELLYHLSCAVHFAHVAHLPAVFAMIDIFCCIEIHKQAVLRDGCLSDVMARLKSAKSGHKMLEQTGQALLCALLWRSDARPIYRTEKTDQVLVSDAETQPVSPQEQIDTVASLRIQSDKELVLVRDTEDDSTNDEVRTDNQSIGGRQSRDIVVSLDSPNPTAEKLEVAIINKKELISAMRDSRKKGTKSKIPVMVSETETSELLTEGELRVLRKKERRSRQKKTNTIQKRSLNP